MSNSKTKAKTIRQVKRFVLSQKDIKDENLVLHVTFEDGKEYEYSPSKVYSQLKDRFEAMNCWTKYKSYTNSKNLPKFVRELDAIV
jgi:hypothetical protein